MFEPIQHIIGNYRLLKRLRQDGRIGVYLGEDQQNQRQVVLKTLDKRIDIVVPQASRAFVHAAHIMARLDHPTIIPLYDLGEQDTLLYLATAYGNPIRQRYPKGTRIPLETVVTYVKQGADALRYAHEQDIIHAHLKPENILLGDRNNVLMSDFGFAEPLYPPAHLSLSSALYTAPEQILGNPQPASDQYALAVMVYEWLSGVLPFTGSAEEVLAQHIETPPPSLKDKLPHLSPLVEEVVMIALRKEPQQRFTTIMSFAIAFEQASLD